MRAEDRKNKRRGDETSLPSASLPIGSDKAHYVTFDKKSEFSRAILQQFGYKD